MTELSVLFSTYFLPQHTYLLRKSNVLCLPLRMKSQTKGETFLFNLYCSMIRPTILVQIFWNTVGCLSTCINQIYIKPYIHKAITSLFCVLDSVSLFTLSLIPVQGFSLITAVSQPRCALSGTESKRSISQRACFLSFNS